jgi:hypothetical protein
VSMDSFGTFLDTMRERSKELYEELTTVYMVVYEDYEEYYVDSIWTKEEKANERLSELGKGDRGYRWSVEPKVLNKVEE